MQLNSTRRRVELSCVAINGPLSTRGTVRPSICLSVTSGYHVNTNGHMITLFLPPSSPGSDFVFLRLIFIPYMSQGLLTVIL